jgi:hypothetical protein
MKLCKIDPDKVTFGTYYQSFLLSKKQTGVKGSSDKFIHKKGSYIKYSPEDFQQKLKEFSD